MPVPLQLATARCCPSVFYGWYVVLLVGFGMSCAAPGHSFFFLNFVSVVKTVFVIIQQVGGRLSFGICSFLKHSLVRVVEARQQGVLIVGQRSPKRV